VLDDARVVCSTPPTLTYAKKAFVSLTVDGSSYCLDGTLTDADGVDTTYNQVVFYYVAASDTPVSQPYQAPVLNWSKCVNGGVTNMSLSSTQIWPPPTYLPPDVAIPETPKRDCRGVPMEDARLAGLGWFGCLEFDSKTANNSAWSVVHSPPDPQWCVRAMPASAGSFYNFHVFDPFHTMTGFFQKSVPLSFPGHCTRFDDPSSLEVQLKLVTVIEVVPRYELGLPKMFVVD
jgi:hypothetical protein